MKNYLIRLKVGHVGAGKLNFINADRGDVCQILMSVNGGDKLKSPGDLTIVARAFPAAA